MQEAVQINLSNDPADARYTQLVTRLVNVINGCDTGVALSCLLSLYRACVLGKPNFHDGARHYLQQILDELKALDGDVAPAATPARAGAPAATNRAVEVSAEVADAAARLTPLIAGLGLHHNVLLAALQFLFFEASLANRCCLPGSVALAANVAEALKEVQDAQPTSDTAPAGHPLH